MRDGARERETEREILIILPNKSIYIYSICNYIYIYSINIHHPNKISNWIDFQDDPSRKNSRASNTAAAAAAVKRDDTGEWNWG